MATEITLYYADWCPHCVSFKPVWNNIKAHCDANKIKHEEYEDSKNSEIMKEKNIGGFPTIKIVKDGKEYEYAGPRTENAILAELKGVKSVQTGGKKKNKQSPVHLSEEDKMYQMKYYKYKAKYIHLKNKLN